MAWNEPGKQEDQKDPWSGQQKRPEKPNLHQIWERIQSQFNAFSKSQMQGSFDLLAKNKCGLLSLLLLLAVIIWVVAGIYIVQPSEQAVITKWGKYVKTKGPGLHWIPRFIESKKIVDVEKIYDYTYDAQSLTKDGNLALVSISVHYRIAAPRTYLFNSVNPNMSLQAITVSLLDQMIGSLTLDDILTNGVESLHQSLKTQLETILNRYQTGIIVTEVNLHPVSVPKEVQSAFNDVTLAEQEEQKLLEQAQNYEMQVEPVAKEQAQSIINEATMYKNQTILQAQADVAPFLALLVEYKQFPQITKERLYLDTMERILKQTSKIFVDINNANNLLYLPLDKLLQQSGEIASTPQLPENQNKVNLSQTTPENNTTKTFQRPSRNESPREDAVNRMEQDP